jgi:hypothetical protein
VVKTIWNSHTNGKHAAIPARWIVFEFTESFSVKRYRDQKAGSINRQRYPKVLYQWKRFQEGRISYGNCTKM